VYILEYVHWNQDPVAQLVRSREQGLIIVVTVSNKVLTKPIMPQAGVSDSPHQAGDSPTRGQTSNGLW
jgi:hypothetical protein